MNAPAGIVMSKMLYPESSKNKINRNLNLNNKEFGSNAIDSLSRGASDGLKLAFNIAAMLLAFIAFVAFINHLLGFFGELTNLYASLANHGRIIPYKISNHQHTNNMPRKRGNHFGSS